MNKEKSIELISRLSNANGISGFEDEVVTVARAYAEKNTELCEDNIRNLYMRRKANTGGKPVVLL